MPTAHCAGMGRRLIGRLTAHTPSSQASVAGKAAPVNTAPKVLQMGGVRYDIERGEMWQGDSLIRLTATEAQLMRIFSARPGEPLSRMQLVEDLGRDRDQAQERAVDVQITRLRRKIEADPKQPRYLQTVRGAGYMLAPDGDGRAGILSISGKMKGRGGA